MSLDRITHRLSRRIPVGTRYLTLVDLDEALFASDGVLNFTVAMTHENGHDCLHLVVKMAEDRRVRPTIQAITAAVPYAQHFSLRASTVDTIPPSMAKRTIIDRRDHA